MDRINSLTYLNNSSIIDYNSVQNVNRNSMSDADAQKEFLKLLVEKVYVRDLKMASVGGSEDEEDDGELSVLSNNLSNMIVNELFRQQLALQLVEGNVIDLGLSTGESK